MRLYDAGAANGGFEEGVEYALAGVLAHPKFLYRFEPKPGDAVAGARYALSGVELASRLSFFLWSSIPDAELLELAAADELGEPAACSSSRSSACSPIRARRRSRRTSRSSGSGSASSTASRRIPFVFGDVDRDIRAHFVTESQPVRRQHLPLGPQRARSADGRSTRS